MSGKARLEGVGMVPFATPSKAEPYDRMAGQAVRAADAGIGGAAVVSLYEKVA